MKKYLMFMVAFFCIILVSQVRGDFESGLVDDTAYNATTWNGVANVAPSKNAVRDKLEAFVGTTVTVADTADTTTFPMLATDAAADVAPKTDAALTYNAATGLLSTTLIKLTSGAGANKLLTSDADGDASWTDSLAVSVLDMTSSTSSIPMKVGTDTVDAAMTAAGKMYFESDTEILSIGDGATIIKLDLYPAAVYTFPSATSTLARTDAGQTFTGVQAFTAPTVATSIAPASADGATLGTSALEFSDIYLADGAEILGQADGTNKITSSASGWTFAKSVSVTAAATTGGYVRLLEGSDNGTDYSMITGIANAGTTAAFTFGGSSTTENLILTIPATTATQATVTSTSGIISLDFTAINLKDVKIITADIDDEAMTIAQMGQVWTNTGDANGTVFTLPEASTVIGRTVTFVLTVAQTLSVNPNDGADTILYGGCSAGDAIQADAIGETVTLMAIDATNWAVLSVVGTWTDVN